MNADRDHQVYDCEICGGLHPWSWDGDCREDDSRFGSVEEYAEAKGITVWQVTVRSMEERVQADGA